MVSTRSQNPTQLPAQQSTSTANQTAGVATSTNTSTQGKQRAIIQHTHQPEDVPRRKTPTGITAEKQTRIDYTLNDSQHTLTVRLQSHSQTDEYACATKYVADCFVDDSKKSCGHLIAFRFDRGHGAWVSALCASRAEGATAETFKVLYTTAGKPRASLSRYPLAGDEVKYIDAFELREPLGGLGLSTAVLDAVHGLFGALEGEFVYSGTVLLSPARPATAHAVRQWGDKSEVDIEQVLMRLYAKAGYEVWVQGDPEVEGSVSVMGRVIP